MQSLSQIRDLQLSDRAVATIQVPGSGRANVGPQRVRVPKFGLNSDPWRPWKFFHNGRMDDVRFSPPTRPPLAKRMEIRRSGELLSGGRAVALPACLTGVKHKGNASHVGITCPNWGALEGPAPAAHAKGRSGSGFRPIKGRRLAKLASPLVSTGAMLAAPSSCPRGELLGPVLGPLDGPAPAAHAKGFAQGPSAMGCTRLCSGVTRKGLRVTDW